MPKPKSLILGLIAIVILSSIAFYLFRTRDPHAPAAVVVSAFRDLRPDSRRIKAVFGTQFDISERAFSVKDALQDMPPGKFYVITLRESADSVIIAYDDGGWEDLKKGPRVFSRRVRDPNRSPNGHLVGIDRWAIWKAGSGRDMWLFLAEMRSAIVLFP